jgi:basic amino acid/polyamine antiporter, APA family
LRDAYGRVSSFLYGWMQIFIAKTGSQAAVAVAFAIGLNDFFNGGLKQILYKTEIFGLPYELTSLQLIAVMIIIIFTTINCASVVLSGQIATFLTFVKVFLVIFVALGAFLFVTGGSFGNFSLMDTSGTCEGVSAGVRYGSESFSYIAGFSAAMLGALWGYDGWNNLSLVAGEVKKPERNIPLALIGGTIAIIFLYVFAHVAYYYVLDPTAIASVSKDSSVAKVVVSKFFGGDMATFATGFAVSVFTIGLMLSSIGTLHTSILTGARVPYAMAQDGMMFKPMGKLSTGTRVPVIALIVQGFWAAVLALSGSFDTLTNYVIFGSWIFYALATSTIFVFRARYPDAVRPYKAFGYPVVPVAFLLVAAFLLFSTVRSDYYDVLDALGKMTDAGIFKQIFTIITAPSIAGIILILIGLPIYYYLTAGSKTNPNAENK